MVASETGTGKTAAFCLPIIQCVHERLRNFTTADKVSTQVPNDVRLSSLQKDADLIIEENGMSCSSSVEKKWIGKKQAFARFIALD